MPGSKESGTLPTFLLLAIWDRVPGSWEPGSASVLRNSVPGVGFVHRNPELSADSVPRISEICSDLPQNERKIPTKHFNGLRNAQK